jgi:hypothetical protein
MDHMLAVQVVQRGRDLAPITATSSTGIGR